MYTAYVNKEDVKGIIDAFFLDLERMKLEIPKDKADELNNLIESVNEAFDDLPVIMEETN